MLFRVHPLGTGAGRLRPRPHIREFTPWGHGILIGLYCSPSGLVRNDWNPGILIELYFSPSGLVRNNWNPISCTSARDNLSQPRGAKGINLDPDWIVLQSLGIGAKQLESHQRGTTSPSPAWLRESKFNSKSCPA